MKNPTKNVKLSLDKLNVISDALTDRIEDIFDIYSLEYNKGRKMYYGSCPIHNGDNNSAFNMYYEGAMYRGNWRCRTHGCEYVFKKTPIGFIRGLLSRFNYNWIQNGDKLAPFNETMDWVSKFLKKDLSKIELDIPHVEKRRFINAVGWSVGIQQNKRCLYIQRDKFIKTPSLSFPSAYFKDRGFSDAILKKYDLADCLVDGKELSHRAVVPIYDDNYQHIVGATGRAIGNYDGDKWKHNAGFPSEDLLFNFWFAKDYINTTKSVVICESPLNIFRLEESGIHNAVAIFGINLSDVQLNKLFQCEIYTVNLLMDNDEAGKTATANLINKLNRIFHTNVVKLPNEVNDVAEMPIDKVKEIIFPQIKVY